MLAQTMARKIQFVAGVSARARISPSICVTIRVQVHALAIVFITFQIFKALAVMTSRLTKLPILRP